MTARAAAGVLAAAAISTACGAPAEGALRPAYGGTARFATSESLRRIDPPGAFSVVEQIASRSVFEALPSLAGFVAEPGDTLWRFTLPRGLLFHDGSPCDAAAVRFSLEASLDAAALLAPAPEPFADSTAALVIAIAAPADTVVEIALAAPGDLPRVLDDPRHAIASRSGAGTGAFRVALARADARPGAVALRLEAFDDHRMGRPYLDAIEFVRASGAADEWRLFTEGRADLIAEPAAPALATAVVAAPDSSLVVIRMPSPLPVFAGAIARAIRPEKMLRFLPRGFGVAPALKPPFGRSDNGEVPSGATCAVSAPAGDPALGRVAERVQVDLLDAGIAARVVEPGTPGALDVLETCRREPPAGSLALLTHERRFAVSAALAGAGVRGCGPDLEWAWRRP